MYYSQASGIRDCGGELSVADPAVVLGGLKNM